MVLGRVHHGQIELTAALPATWEGQVVSVAPVSEQSLTPDDPIPDLEARLAALHALGPMDYEPGEREAIEQALKVMNELGRAQMSQAAGLVP
jgi:hypothetical protein